MQVPAPVDIGSISDTVRVGLRYLEGDIGKGEPIEVIVEREQTMAAAQRVSANQKIGKDAARSRVAVASATGSVALERTPGHPPDGFVQVPVQFDAGILKEQVEESFRAAGEGQEF